jgi:hypothetical protein
VKRLGHALEITQRDEVQCASMRALRYDILDVLKEPCL